MLSCAWVNAKLGLNKEDINVTSDEVINEADYGDPIHVLDLETKEKLTDGKGNVYEIEVRGERHPDKIYFKVKDVSEQLYMPNLRKSITSKTSTYYEGRHYVRFYVHKLSEGKVLLPLKGKTGSKNILFFTYHGFLKLLYSSSNQKCDRFLDWVTNVVFTAHLGTKLQKQTHAAKLVGVDRKTLRDVLSKSKTSQSCIYLIYLGKAKDLATTFKIKDYEPNESIYKFGRTINLTKRMDQHYAKYSKLGCNLGLSIYEPIDPIFNTEAENDIKEYFIDENLKVDNKKYVKLDDADLKPAELKYQEISKMYMGKYTELNNKNKLIEKECELKIANTVAEKNAEIIKLSQDMINLSNVIHKKDELIINLTNELMKLRAQS